MALTRSDLQDRLASAAFVAGSQAAARDSAVLRLLAAHLRATLASVQAGPIAEGPRPVGEPLDALITGDRTA